jgi:hypothetical protein
MAFFRTNYRGRLPGDIWQFGFVMQSDEGIDGLADRMGSQMVSTLTATIRGYFGTGVVFDDVYVSEIAEGSGTVLNTAVQAVNVAGTVGSAVLPPQTSVAVSILPLAGTQRGRFYLPPMAPVVLGTNGRITSAVQTALADAFQGFFSALGSAGAPARLGIWRTSGQSFAAARGIQVGDVIDTQRRRRNKLIESRVDRLVL